MFDFAWSEIALIGVVALVAIGPKDMPVAIKAVAGMIKKARRMAAEFQTHVDELVKEADLHEVRDQFKQLRNFDFRGEIEKAVDSDGSIRSTLSQNPLAKPEVNAFGGSVADATTGTTTGVTSDATYETRVLERPDHMVVPPEPEHSILPREAPAFIPPATVAAEAPVPAAPAFIPPEYAASDPHRT